MIDKLYNQTLKIRIRNNHCIQYQIYFDRYVEIRHIARYRQDNILETCLIDEFDFELFNKTFEVAKIMSTKRKIDIEFFKKIGGRNV